jgi:hypothetical protein
VGTAWQAPPVQIPEQHCDGCVQDCVVARQMASAHTPFVQASEPQHWVGLVQGSPADLHTVSLVQCPFEQVFEQHAESEVQLTSWPRHTGGGGGLQCPPPSQTSPTQHWGEEVHGPPWAPQEEAGAHRELASQARPGQHSGEDEHDCVSVLQLAGSAQ